MLLVASSTFITLALIFYSIGVWAERMARFLKIGHVVCFWTGFIFDVTGTLAMHHLAVDKFDILEPHTLTGQIALWLMLIHALWASWVAIKGTGQMHTNFHRYSLFVWIIWLIPYFGGIYIGMYGNH